MLLWNWQGPRCVQDTLEKIIAQDTQDTLEKIIAQDTQDGSLFLLLHIKVIRWGNMLARCVMCKAQ